MQKKWWFAGALVLLAVTGGGAYYAGLLPPGSADKKVAKAADKGAAAAKDDGPALQFVATEVTRASMAPMAQTITFSGPLVAPNTALVRAKASGTLLSLSVAEGGRVRAGQMLGTIDVSEASSRVAERQALLEAQRAALAQAERSHTNNVALAAQNFISASALDASKSALDTTKAQANAALASLNTAKVGLRDAGLLAPIAGIVAKRHALPGEKLSPEQQVLTIVDLSRLELAGNVGTHEVARLQPGQAVLVKVEGSDAEVAAKLARIAPAAEAGTRSIGVAVVLDNPRELWRAGQYATATVRVADDAPRLTLPNSAIMGSGGQASVWVIEGGALKRRAISTGRRDEASGRVEVLDGLPAQAEVLAVKFENLREGQKASIVTHKTAPAASAPAVSAPSASAATDAKKS